MFNTNLNINRFGGQQGLRINAPYYQTYIDGDYQVVKFYYQTGSTVAGNGSGSFVLPYTRQVEYLIIGGGGTGGGADISLTAIGGGGGAGQLLSGSFLYLANQQFDFAVGQGGQGVRTSAPNTSQGLNGLPTVLSGTAGTGQINFTAIGGGGGGAFVRNGDRPPPDFSGTSGSNGGSGGGGGWDGTDSFASANTGGASLAMSGSAGGYGFVAGFYGAGGGGGGALTSGSIGYEANATTIYGGNGGSGSFSAI